MAPRSRAPPYFAAHTCLQSRHAAQLEPHVQAWVARGQAPASSQAAAQTGAPFTNTQVSPEEQRATSQAFVADGAHAPTHWANVAKLFAFPPQPP